jgi:hypothetical protein
MLHHGCVKGLIGKYTIQTTVNPIEEDKESRYVRSNVRETSWPFKGDYPAVDVEVDEIISGDRPCLTREKHTGDFACPGRRGCGRLSGHATRIASCALSYVHVSSGQ